MENLTPIALLGAGGIGKTSIALTVLHQDRIKHRFGENRRFIRCDQFQASRANLLNRLSKVIGAGDCNPEDLTPLRRFLSSNETLIVLDNAESILDPRGDHAEEIYDVVEELSQINDICLVITSRITAVPPDCESLEIPTLSMEAARDAFYRIYKGGGPSDLVGDVLKQLDFHPLSVTLLATVAHQNEWDNHRLGREWDKRQTGVLRTDRNKSLAATIELSLSSPMFRDLGPDARELLGVIAFFPQGVDENNIDWLFPTISDGTPFFDKFCMLSLTYRSNGFTTMLAPLREYLRPNDPNSSSLLLAAKKGYFTRMSVDLDPNSPEFEGTRWISSEDVNIEHLLDVFASTDANSDEVWNACASFIGHLYWHKPRQTVLKSRIEGLSDDHRSKPDCLFELSQLFGSIGNHMDRKRLLIHTLELERGRGNDSRVARVLRELSDANGMLGLYAEGMPHVNDALAICEGLGDKVGQARCLNTLAWSHNAGGHFHTAIKVASRAITLLPGSGQEYLTCKSHRVLGEIYSYGKQRRNAIHHFETAVRIASPFEWHDILFSTHHSLAYLFLDEEAFEDAQAHVNQVKSHVVWNAYNLGQAMEAQARIWYQQYKLKDATSEVLGAIEVFEKLGAASDVERCKMLLWANWMLQRNSGSHPPMGKTCQSNRSLSVTPSDGEYGPGTSNSIVSQVCILVPCHEHRRQNPSSDFVLPDKLSEEMVRGIFSDDPPRQLNAAKKFGMLLNKGRKPMVELAVECGVVPRFVQFLQGDHAMLQVGIIPSNNQPLAHLVHPLPLIAHMFLPLPYL